MDSLGLGPGVLACSFVFFGPEYLIHLAFRVGGFNLAADLRALWVSMSGPAGGAGHTDLSADDTGP